MHYDKVTADVLKFVDEFMVDFDTLNDDQKFTAITGAITGGVVAAALLHGLSMDDAMTTASHILQVTRTSIDAVKAERKRIRESN